MVEALRRAARRTVGTNQTVRAVERGEAVAVFVARDAEPHVVRHLLGLCGQRGVPVHEVESMWVLGRLCGVEVGAASAAILGEGRRRAVGPAGQGA
jgi:large subunit ribosomal protein L7A